MIHFLGKVYLEYGETKPQVNHMMARPHQYVRIIDKGLSLIIDKDSFKDNIIDYKNVQACIEDFKTLDGFINFLNEKSQGERVVIYCDEESMPLLLCSLWKSVFPNISKETAYSFYVSFKDYEHIKKDYGSEYINIAVNSEKLSRRVLLPVYWNKSKQDFYDIFQSAQTFTIEGREDLVGLEYAFIKMIKNKELNQAIYFPKLENLYKKNLAKEIIIMSETIKEYALFLLENKSLTEKTSLNDQSVFDYLKAQDKYKVLFDEKLDFSSSTYEYLKINYNILKVINDLYVDCVTIHSKINPPSISIDDLKQELTIVSHIIENKEEPSCADLISTDIFDFTNYHFLRNYINMGIFNQMIVQSVLVTNKINPSLLADLE